MIKILINVKWMNRSIYIVRRNKKFRKINKLFFYNNVIKIQYMKPNKNNYWK